MLTIRQVSVLLKQIVGRFRSAFHSTDPSAYTPNPTTNMLPQVFNSANGSYMIHPQALATVPASAIGINDAKPFLILSPNNGQLGEADVLNAVAKFTKDDDVFSSDFLTDVVGVLSAADVQPTVDLVKFGQLDTAVGPWDIKSVIHVTSDSKQPLLPGPYFLYGNGVHQAWKLYADDLDAFSVSTYQKDVQKDNSTFAPLHFLDTEGIWKTVAVPSRLYSARSKERPLAGQRITIKDNYLLAGVKSTLSNRAYEATYGPDQDTAALVQKLIQLGAVVVGKTKMSAFASAEEPTDHWVDFHAPFNPRGDGYQTPAGSSNGAAAALSGYPWLDLCLGTDTSGSIRYPAAICGLFGLRYTSHTIPMTGIRAACHEFDAVGLVGRDLKTFHDFVAETVVGGPGNITKYPKRIIYPKDFLPYEEEPMENVLDEFVKQLESFLGVSREVISIADVWAKNPPPEGQGKTIEQFLGKTGFYPFYYDGYHENRQLLEDHRKKFDKDVYFGPYMRWKMETGSKVTLEQKEQALRECSIYRKWFSENILRADDETASDAVLIMPVSCYAPDYRDKAHKEPGCLPAHSENYLASILRFPQLVLPVGQVTYESRVSGRTEHHPITASLVGAEGSDLMLTNLARDTFAHAGWTEQLLTGRYTWKLGQGPRNVADAESKSGVRDEL